MSYEKTTWETGDIITAEKLNNIENGVESAQGGAFYAQVEQVGEDTYGFANCEYADIVEAYNNGKVIIFVDLVEYMGSAVGVADDTGGFFGNGFMVTNSLETGTVLNAFRIECGMYGDETFVTYDLSTIPLSGGSTPK